ncbi:cell division protein ZapA [Proteiniborus ethanoligenes]|uniref:Cell division protein ZapA n=1 Tax=Proteiniborus ethanoligenes TaxID=415015 RepID=A0A1H3RV51_9FIRM|nr:cell division protein ZapA [Proteiniborus ethanoligenes]SDZ29583.1 cell division protein ZapA [Proteiniborus ethanoligenes]
MTNKERVIVNIGGQEFSVVGNESEEYIKGIAKLVDDNIKEITKKNKRLSQSMAAILAAFNIGDKYTKSLKDLNDLRKNTVEPLNQFEQMKSELEESKNKLQAVKSECDSYKDELLQSKREIEKLNRMIRKQEEDLKLKDEEVINNNKTIDDLQNKLFESQVEMVQIRKELREALKMLDMD